VAWLFSLPGQSARAVGLPQDSPRATRHAQGFEMAKEELIEMRGKVAEILPDSRCRVILTNGHELVAYTGGKMKKHRIRIIAGDDVTLEMSPYDLTKGRIMFRHLPDRRPPGSPPPHRR
jgi:translation initiation factor IF-1